MKRVALLLLTFAVTLPLFATAQAPDILKVGDKVYDINSNPLTPWLLVNGKRMPQPPVTSTGLWRGYVATWRIRDQKLFLEDVQQMTKAIMDRDAPEEKQWRSVMRELFDSSDPQPAVWFTGNLIVPTGEMVDYVHMGYGSTYASYLVVTVVKGEVLKQRDMNAKQFTAFRRAQFDAYKKTKDYGDALAELKSNEPSKANENERFLYEFLTEEYLSRIFDDVPLH